MKCSWKKIDLPQWNRRMICNNVFRNKLTDEYFNTLKLYHGGFVHTNCFRVAKICAPSYDVDRSEYVILVSRSDGLGNRYCCAIRETAISYSSRF